MAQDRFYFWRGYYDAMEYLSDEEAGRLFRAICAYAFEGEAPVRFFGMDMGIALRVYKTADEDAGAYRYFAFTDDTLADTYHIEFRYGESMEALGDYSDGEYAYWLAAGINEGYRENQIKSCIKLFVDENVGGEEE